MTRHILSPFAEWMLRRLVPRHWRDSIEGDLLEELDRRAQRGRSTHGLRDACSVVAISVRLAIEARFGRSVPRRTLASRRGRLETIWADFKFSARALNTNRMHAGLAITTLALSISANTAVFNVANWLLLRPLPGVDQPGDLVNVRFKLPNPDSTTPVSLDEMRTIAEGTPALDGLAGLISVPMSVTIGAGTTGRRVPIEFVTSNYFDVVRARVQGRDFTAEEERVPGAAPVVVVSRTLASREFPGLMPVGRTMAVNGITTTVVGVAPAEFRGTRLTAGVDLWMPIAQRYVALPSSARRPAVESATSPSLFALVGRLAPHQTTNVLQQQLDALDQQLTARFPNSSRFGKSHFYVLSHLEFYGRARTTLVEVFGVLMAAAVMLLLLACANVGNAILGRAMLRRGEIATRLALGATRTQIVRLLLAESALIAAASAVIAIVAAQVTAWAIEGMVILPFLPPLERALPDWRVVASAVALSTLAAVSAGLSPAWAVRKIELTQLLQASGRSMSHNRQGVRRALMAVQVTVSVALIAVAVLLVRSIDARLALNPGFDARHLLTFSLDPRLPPERPANALHRDLVARVRKAPGIRSASLAFFPPFYVGTEAQLLFHTDTSMENIRVALNAVRTGFFDTIGLPFVAGRDFTDSDLASDRPQAQSPLIISESVARRTFGTTSVVGRSVISSTNARREIVGVVRGSRQRGLTNDDTDNIAFQPYLGSYSTPFVTVVVSVANPRVDAWPQLRRAVSDVDPSLVMFDTRRGEDGIRANFGPETLTMRVALAFGMLAIVLSAIGLSSTLARCLAERHREFGIRAALGATPTRIAGLVVREAGIVLPPGIAIGILIGLALARYLASSLYGVTPVDVTSFVAAVALVTAVMAIASIPACLRASRIDTTEALKEQ